MRFCTLINKIKCKLGKHERVYWTIDECESANVMSGIWTPWKCKRCGYESYKFPRPKQPIAPNPLSSRGAFLPIILEGDNVMLDLGDKVKDRITGFTGIAVGKTDWIYGCTRIGVQPEMDKEGKLQEVQWFDILSLDVVEKNAINRQKNMEKETTEYVKTGGPMPFTPQRNKEENR